jgi:hypothetical protein
MNNKTVKLPRLRVKTIDPEGLSISFDEPRWIGERWIACIMLSPGRFIWGRFASISTEDRTAKFILDNKKEVSLFQIGSEYEYLDGYWGERAELVFDSSHKWEKTEFVPRDELRHLANGTTEVVPDGWDHEHCRICWESISQVDEQKYGYKDQNDKWLCDQCFHSYVEQKKIDFITEPQQLNQGDGE